MQSETDMLTVNTYAFIIQIKAIRKRSAMNHGRYLFVRLNLFSKITIEYPININTTGYAEWIGRLISHMAIDTKVSMLQRVIRPPSRLKNGITS